MTATQAIALSIAEDRIVVLHDAPGSVIVELFDAADVDVHRTPGGALVFTGTTTDGTWIVTDGGAS